MQQQRFYYLFRVQYLGYRLHGWQRQPGLKTVEGMIKKTLKFVLGERRFKILGASRTDAMVSAQLGAFELFLDGEPLRDLPLFLEEFNKNLPPDIRVTEIEPIEADFNIIQHPKMKEYSYFFAFGKKSHPFAAPLLATFLEPLDIEQMIAGAQLFQGQHSFHNYCTKPSENTILERYINRAEIRPNNVLTASFFPKESFEFRVEGAGFLRNQIRLMMGALVLLGRGEFTLEDIRESLKPEKQMRMNYIAPGSGLTLNNIDFY